VRGPSSVADRLIILAKSVSFHSAVSYKSRITKTGCCFGFRLLPLVMVDFEVIGEITEIEVIAVNLSIREHKGLKAQFGGRRWRKLKGKALVRFPNGEVHQAELQWYEAHGVGRRKMKVKRRLD
jgi:hypothetical protein